MFYRLVQAVVAFAVRLFYRVRVSAPPLEPEGSVIFVGNHPNGLMDPALVFILTRRKVTFLAKAPLFALPVLGALLRGLDALPVFRRQDDPGQMNRNEGTFEAATGALVEGRALTLFPEGKSHSEPGLAELKTGAARIAFRAQARGARVRIVPVGLTYAEKHRFRSEVLIDVGPAIEVADFSVPSGEGEGEVAAVQRLTERIAQALKERTLNLAAWEDLPLVRTAEQLYALRQGERPASERLRTWARGLELFRAEQPARFEAVRAELVGFQRRLALVRADPSDLALGYRPAEVARFVGNNLASLLLGLPLFALGVLLYVLPFQLPRAWVRLQRTELDVQATVKFLGSLVLAPLWWALLTFVAWRVAGPAWALLVFAAALPLALFTRYFLARWREVLRDVAVFFALGSRARLKARLLQEGARLSAEVERLAGEYGPRVSPPQPGAPAAEAR
ncbi:acyltransferase [Aggregicoccus sp. 17bor-14]|uniref:1-acyl-sn-glycerol-3-phosphate acyltransferase n=1 Tax=Myxococcaceae TaxID=31 RepID=UPI0012EFA868|nr:1-acyl-sn-glycerol-3-phosphate acyltransferase [Simulacricoccus sp. 17bor-14]MRI90009.1 acyltransferase [Aggregicoccus sp. 17bor-14]